MANKAKTFLVSTADFALFYDEKLACTGTTNLNTSIEVSMEEQNVNAGKGNKLVYSYKYGRKLNVSLETADWKLEYLAANLGNDIAVGLSDIYKISECVTINEGVGILPNTPIGDVAVELSDDTIITVTPTDGTIDLTSFGVTSGTVNVTYKFSNVAKSIVIDADTSPKVFKLVLDADKHNNKLGKVGSVQIVIPSYQPDGNFTMEFTPDGVSSTNINGKALAVDGDTCESGSAVYAYVTETDLKNTALTVSDIAATPGTINLDTTDNTTVTISVVGMKGVMYSSIELDNSDCTFVSDMPTVATVGEKTGEVTAVATGNAKITVTYNGITDDVDVVVA